MSLLLELNLAASSVAGLEKFIEDNFSKLFDFFSLLNDVELVKCGIDFKLIQLRISSVEALDFSKNVNISFLHLLLHAAIRLGERMHFQALYNLAMQKKIMIDTIINASSYYLMNVRIASDVLDRYDDIAKGLENSLDEEDNQDSALTSLFNCYSLLIRDFEFATNEINELRDKIWNSYKNQTYYFIQNPIIEVLYQVDISKPDAYDILQKILDDFLGRNRTIAEFDASNFIIESEGVYFELLDKPDYSFEEIRKIGADEYMKIKNDAIFYSLGRGTNILQEAEQLLAYIFAFGKMHNRKLVSAFEYLPDFYYDENVHIVDWACGQGLATVSYLDFLRENETQQTISSITLIEPSQVALKRASLHVNKWINKEDIKTINKDFDSLHDSDVSNSQNSMTLHFFSNVLDMNLFSLERLIQLIDKNFSGKNVFVITSPYVNVTKTSRIDAFVNHYRQKSGFVQLGLDNNLSETWIHGKNWSRVLRVFEVEL